MPSPLPPDLAVHDKDYLPGSWETYTYAELAQWVALLTKRAAHRVDKAKARKDLYDAENYAGMLMAKFQCEKDRLLGDQVEQFVLPTAPQGNVCPRCGRMMSIQTNPLDYSQSEKCLDCKYERLILDPLTKEEGEAAL